MMEDCNFFKKEEEDDQKLVDLLYKIGACSEGAHVNKSMLDVVDSAETIGIDPENILVAFKKMATISLASYDSQLKKAKQELHDDF